MGPYYENFVYRNHPTPLRNKLLLFSSDFDEILHGCRVEGGVRPLDMIDKIDLRTPRLSNLIYFIKFKTVLTLISQNLGNGWRFKVVSNRENERKLSEIRDFRLLHFLLICLASSKFANKRTSSSKLEVLSNFEALTRIISKNETQFAILFCKESKSEIKIKQL